MNATLEAYRAAGLRSVEFQLEYQQPDGGFIWDESIRDAYHKQPYSWGVSGTCAPAHKLLNWIKANTLQEEGGLKDYNGDVYKQSWFFQGAHRLGRFDISYPIFEFLLSCQTPCGGFPHFARDEFVRSLATAWTGVSALYMGRLDVAEEVVTCCTSMLDQQTVDERFYFQMTRDGRLVTPEVSPNAGFIDFTKPNQPYWELGLIWMLMGRMYQVTRDATFLELAERCFELHRKCADDRFSYVGSGKSSLAAAIHYLNTGDTRARDAVYTFLDFLLRTQHPEGGWCGPTEQDIPLIHIDHGAEFNVWIQEDVSILASIDT